MNLNTLKDNELNEKVKNLAGQERKLTQVILEHIAEVDRRKLFLSMAYPSLFDYLTKEIGYSAGAAQRRIDAARLLQRIPEVSGKIQDGSLNLGQISKLQQICRQIKRDSGQKVSVQVQKDVLQKLENLNSQQTDLQLAQQFQLEVKIHAQTKIQRDESTRVELTFSKSEMALIKAAQAVLSHKTGGGLKETLLALAKDILNAKRPTATVEVNSDAEMDLTIKSPVESRQLTKTVTPRLKKDILNRDKYCQFMDVNTGRVCGSKYHLEVDHIIPRFVGGDNNPKNLRAMCKNHNLFRYRAGLQV